MIVVFPDHTHLLFLMNYDSSFVLFDLFLSLNKRNVKKSFMTKFNIPHSENLYTFQNAKCYIKIFQ